MTCKESAYDTREDESPPSEEYESYLGHAQKEEPTVRWRAEVVRCEWFTWPLRFFSATQRRPWGFREGYGVRWGWWIVRWYGGLKKWGR